MERGRLPQVTAVEASTYALFRLKVFGPLTTSESPSELLILSLCLGSISAVYFEEPQPSQNTSRTRNMKSNQHCDVSKNKKKLQINLARFKLFTQLWPKQNTV